MDRKKQKKIQIAAAVIAVAMIGSLFGGIIYGKEEMEKPEEQQGVSEERPVSEDGFRKYVLGDVISVENGYLAALTNKEWVKNIPLSEEDEDKRITAEDGKGFLVFRGAFQKEYPGLINMYEELKDFSVIVNNEYYEAKVTVGEKSDVVTPYSLKTYEEIPLYFYVELNEDMKDEALEKAEFELELSSKTFLDAETEATSEEKIQKYRFTENTGK